MACEDPYRPGHMMFAEIDPKLLEEKLRSPLYAASIHLAANTR